MDYITAGSIAAGCGVVLIALGWFISIFTDEGKRWVRLGVGALVLGMLCLAYGLGITTKIK